MLCCPRAGFGLVNYKLTSTWAEHCPAYYLAISLEQKQVIISIRGTAQVEDVITDLTALPAVRAPAHTRRYLCEFMSPARGVWWENAYLCTAARTARRFLPFLP